MVPSDTVLFHAGADRITVGDLAQTLHDLGVRRGDLLFLHTDLLRFGRIAPGMLKHRNALFDALIETLRAAVGPEGTLLMLTLSVRTLHTGRFEVATTPSEGGALTEYYRSLPGVVRTPHPTHSAAGEGPKMPLFMAPPAHPFGSGSLFDLLKEENGKLLFLGADFHWCTFNHHIETLLPVKYRKEIPMPMTLVHNGQEKKTTALRFRKPARYWTSFARFRTALIDRGILKEAQLGKGTISLAPASAVFEAGTELLSQDALLFMNVQPLRRFLVYKLKERAGKLLRALGLR